MRTRRGGKSSTNEMYFKACGMLDFVGNFWGQYMLKSRVLPVQNHSLFHVSAHESWAIYLPNVSFPGTSGSFQHKQGFTPKMLQTSDQKTTCELFTGTQGPQCQDLPGGAVLGTLTLSVLVPVEGLFLCKL